MKTMVKFVCVFVFAAVANTDCASIHKPLIGITSVYRNGILSVHYNYIEAIEENNGLPLVLPSLENQCAIESLVRHLHGLVLIGGDDIPPQAYGESPHATVKLIDSKRYRCEHRLIEKWLESGKPILGICLGMQFTNVVAGGTLIQDIPSQIGTQVDHRCCGESHGVVLDPTSTLAHILKAAEINVYSNHHQAVKVIGKNFRVAARSEDGLIEALERIDGRFGLLLQWHPEAMKNDPNHRDAIFSAFVEAAAN